MSSFEKSRFMIGGLLLLAALALGAGLPEEPGMPEAAAPEASPSTDGATDEPAATESAPLPVDAVVPAVPAPARPARPVAAPLVVMEGGASWYADALAGRRTASGERYDPSDLIAAHRALPFGTRLRVTNLANQRSVEVRVIDRGPFVAGRVLDLSRSAAQQIGMIRAGHARVRIEVLEYGS